MCFSVDGDDDSYRCSYRYQSVGRYRDHHRHHRALQVGHLDNDNTLETVASFTVVVCSV